MCLSKGSGATVEGVNRGYPSGHPWWKDQKITQESGSMILFKHGFLDALARPTTHTAVDPSLEYGNVVGQTVRGSITDNYQLQK